MKNLKQNIRIHNADPSERVKVKIAFLDIAVKRRPFIAADFQIDAHLLQLFFNRLGDTPPQIDVRGFERQMKTWHRAVAVRNGIAGFVEESLGALGIVRPAPHVRLIGPIERRQQTAGDRSSVFEKMAHQTVAIDGISQRLADFDIS